jgi:putative hemolysin
MRCFLGDGCATGNWVYGKMLFELLFILVLISVNGFFAASEIAVVLARQSRLQNMLDEGDRRAKIAIRLREAPAEFLATVQIGITMVGTLASAVGGVEAAQRLSPLIAQVPFLSPYAGQLALGVVVMMISYISLLIGELVPKRLAIRNPERLAVAVVRTFDVLARIARLPIRFLTLSADFLLRLFPSDLSDEQVTSPEEIEFLVHRGAAEGVILPVQERLITRVFDYTDRITRDEMTPRTEIIALEAETPLETALAIAKEHGYSRFPVYRGNRDHILGYVHIKDLIWAPTGTPLERLIRQVVYIPERATLPQAFTALTRRGRQMGIVLDEYGGTEGLITLENLLEVIVGEIEDEHSPLADLPEQDAEGIWELNGTTAIVEVGELLGVDFEPHGVYNTLAGFIMAELGAIPKRGDTFVWNGFAFTVEEMERFKILQVCIRRILGGEKPDRV